MENNIIIAHPTTADQIIALKDFLKSLKIKFEIKNEGSYNPEFVDKVLERREQYKKGNFKVIKTEDLWK